MNDNDSIDTRLQEALVRTHPKSPDWYRDPEGVTVLGIACDVQQRRNKQKDSESLSAMKRVRAVQGDSVGGNRSVGLRDITVPTTVRTGQRAPDPVPTSNGDEQHTQTASDADTARRTRPPMPQITEFRIGQAPAQTRREELIQKASVLIRSRPNAIAESKQELREFGDPEKLTHWTD